MKDKLRKSGCPENLSVEILGYSQGSVAANYGSGYAIEVMREALVKVWGSEGGYRPVADLTERRD